jgi:hypothetical protein
MDNYTPSAIPLYANRPNCWTRSQLDVPQEEYRTICSVWNVGLAAYSVTSFSEAPPTPPVPTDFWGIIKRWGNTWMWKNLTIRGDVSWLVELITDNTLVVVTDGSYMKDTYPHLTLAAFIRGGIHKKNSGLKKKAKKVPRVFFQNWCSGTKTKVRSGCRRSPPLRQCCRFPSHRKSTPLASIACH